ncbi:hypothetical protein EAF00_011019 [Botryotinia globosa]|nr:hypothetical protein EAF00_011019 [Botryotinia globosa]
METHLSLPEDVDEGEFTRLQERICDLGAIIKHTPKYTWKTELLRIFIRQTQRIDVIDLPTILEAIFLQSEKGLEHILSQDPSAANEVLYESGETPLHLAHQWPQGLKILIRAGGNVNQCNDCGELPLTLAANRNCYSSMKILLEKGSMLRTYSPQYSRSLSGDDASDFLRCIRNRRDSWRSTIFDHLIQRRHGLLELAQSLMTVSPTSMSGWLKTDRVLDARAADVVKELKRHRVNIDPKLLPAFHPKTTTVYHMKNLTPELAEALYQSGFLDIDSRDHEGRLPILAQTKFETDETFDLPRWLITKGVDLTGTLDEEKMITTLHDVCSSIGNNYRRWIIENYEETKKPPEDIDLTDVEFSQNIPLDVDLLDVDVIDSCVCACSMSGCLPITCFLGNMQVEFRTGNPDHLCGSWEVLGDDPWVTWRGELMVRIFAKMLESRFSTCPWLVHNIIRQCTFYKLGLTHTCKCSQRICPPASSFTKDEVYNIMEEEQDMIEQLESLTAEFEKNFANCGKPLHAFLKDDWKSRMEEVTSESTLNEEYMKEVREIGVVMR